MAFSPVPVTFGSQYAATRVRPVAVTAPMDLPYTPEGFAQDPVFSSAALQQAQTGYGTDAYGSPVGSAGPFGQNIDPRGSGAINAGNVAGQIGGFIGGPIGSLAGSVIGTGIDTALANDAIQASIPGAPSIGWGGFASGLLSGLSFGLTDDIFGTQSIEAQMNAALSPGVDPGYQSALPGNVVAEALGQIPGSVLSSSYPDAPPSPYGVLGVDIGYAPVGGYDQSDNGVSGGGYGGTTSSNGPEPSGANSANDSNNGFAFGGYTGDGAPWEPAGTVHRGEVVLNAPATDYYGANNLAALNRRDLPRNALAEILREHRAGSR